MESIVWWSAGGGSLNKEASWRALLGGAPGGESLNKEASWRALLGGVQGGLVEIKKLHGEHCWV